MKSSTSALQHQNPHDFNDPCNLRGLVLPERLEEEEEEEEEEEALTLEVK